MWGSIFLETYTNTNYSFSFPSENSQIILQLIHWQYWWWFWFTFFIVLYYLFFLRSINFSLLKFSPSIVTSFRAHGKWGDFLVCFIPLSWCINILTNSNFILRLLEWQMESSLLLLRVRGKQWFWIYKFELTNLISLVSSAKNVGSNYWLNLQATNIQQFNEYLTLLQLKHNARFVSFYWENLFLNNFSQFMAPSSANITSLWSEFSEFSLQQTAIMSNNKLSYIWAVPSYYGKLHLPQLLLKTNWVSIHLLQQQEYVTVDGVFVKKENPGKLLSRFLNMLHSTAQSNFKGDLTSWVLLASAPTPKITVPMSPYTLTRFTFLKLHNINLTECSYQAYSTNSTVNQYEDNIFYYNSSWSWVLKTFFDKAEQSDSFLFKKFIYYLTNPQLMGFKLSSSASTWNLTYLSPEINRLQKSFFQKKFISESLLINSSNISPADNIVKVSPHNHSHLYWVMKQKRQVTKSQCSNVAFSDYTYLSAQNRPFIRSVQKMNEFTQQYFNRRLLRTNRILLLPTNVNITLITNSFDVIHSWYIPGLGIKLDCVPGRSTHHNINIQSSGFYYGQCAEICGRYHHHMPIRICAIPFFQFIAWWSHFGVKKFTQPSFIAPKQFVF